MPYSLLLTLILIQTNFCYGMDANTDNISPRGMKRLLEAEESSHKPQECNNFLAYQSFEQLPADIIEMIVLASPFKALFVNKNFYFLATGYYIGEKISALIPGSYIDNPEWARTIDFNKLQGQGDDKPYLNSASWYRFTTKVSNLPTSKFHCLRGTNVCILDLFNNRLGALGIEQLHLNDTKIHTLNLRYNQLGGAGTATLMLHDSNVHTLDLSYNAIGDTGAQGLKLKNTKIHTLILTDNWIGAAGAIKLQLQGSNVHTLNLRYNQIGDNGAQGLPLQGSNVHTLDLAGNQISDSGAVALPLKGSKVQSVDLRWNLISKAVQLYLQETYPHITFNFSL